MINTVTNGGPVGDPPDRRPGRERDGDGRERPPREGSAEHHGAPAAYVPGSGVPEHRLVVEADEAGGVLTYRWVDRKTGAVISELTREDLKKLKSDPNYHAGAWLNTKA